MNAVALLCRGGREAVERAIHERLTAGDADVLVPLAAELRQGVDEDVDA